MNILEKLRIDYKLALIEHIALKKAMKLYYRESKKAKAKGDTENQLVLNHRGATKEVEYKKSRYKMRVMHAAISALEGKPYKSVQSNSFPDRRFCYSIAKLIGGCSESDVLDWANGLRKYIEVHGVEIQALQQKIKAQINVLEDKKFRNVICRQDNVLRKKDDEEGVKWETEWKDELKKRYLAECARKFDKEQAELETQYTKEGKKLDRLVAEKDRCIVLDFIRYAKLSGSLKQKHYDDNVNHEKYPGYLDWFISLTQKEKENIMVKYVLDNIASEPFSAIKDKLGLSR